MRRDVDIESTVDIFTVFFFSSKRRHTKWNCDWSSDVCSSDLATRRSRPSRPSPASRGSPGRVARSEERRVGKECRSLWSPNHYKKKVRLVVLLPFQLLRFSILTH